MHATSSTADGLTGALSFDLDKIEETAHGSVTVPMARMSFGDRLRDWGMRRHLNVKRWPTAVFDVSTARVESREPWCAQIDGVIRYRDVRLPVSVTATGTVTEESISAQATFECRLTDLGIAPPRFLVLKVADVVQVEVRLYASATGC